MPEPLSAATHVSESPPTDPFVRFRAALDRALAAELPEPTAMSLATVDDAGRPSCRVVLLKGFDEEGFTFYTNLTSRKGLELRGESHAALCFYWPQLQLQVRIEGAAAQVSDVEADAYFATRPRGSQVGAWASRQSQPLPTRATLEQRIAEVERRFEGEAIPRPDFWSGYRVVPERIEFWEGLPSRLHDRDVYTRGADGTWTTEKIYP